MIRLLNLIAQFLMSGFQQFKLKDMQINSSQTFYTKNILCQEYMEICVCHKKIENKRKRKKSEAVHV